MSPYFYDASWKINNTFLPLWILGKLGIKNGEKIMKKIANHNAKYNQTKTF